MTERDRLPKGRVERSAADAEGDTRKGRANSTHPLMPSSPVSRSVTADPSADNLAPYVRLYQEAVVRAERAEAEGDEALHAEDVAEQYRERAEADNQGLREALRGLMNALSVDEEGTVSAPFDQWSKPWMDALDALASAPQETAGCEHRNVHFDRSLCACGEMHHYCDDCGFPLDCPIDAPQETEQ